MTQTVTDVIDNALVVNRPSESSFTKNKRTKQYQHLCLDREYNSKSVKQQIVKQRLCSS
jgi:hypothetical protein